MTDQNATVNASKQRLAAKKKPTSCFNRKALPLSVVCLQRLGIQPKKMNAGGYWIVYCPFHKNGKEKNPSLHIHKSEGYYRCHACGAKGCDMLAFYRAVTGKSFETAARALGTWEDM